MASGTYLIDKKSEHATNTELDLFSVPPTTVTIEQSFWEVLNPINPITNYGPYEFLINGTDHYVDMASNFVELKIRITNADGSKIRHTIHNVVSTAIAGRSLSTTIGDEDEEETEVKQVGDGKEVEIPPNFVAAINMIGATFWKQVKMIVNGKLTFDSGPDYPYLAYILTDLNYGSDAKNGPLQLAGYYKDCTAEFEDDGRMLNTWESPGAQKRALIQRDSRSGEYMATLHIPFAHQERYLLSHLDIRLELHRVSDAFALMSPFSEHKYKIMVDDIKFHIRKVELKRDLYMSLEKQITLNPAKYPVRRTELKTLHIGFGMITTPNNALWNGQLPRRVILCTIPNKNYHGSYDTNPFLFHPNGVKKVCLYVNGKCVPYSGPLEVKFYNTEEEGTSLVAQAFNQLYTATGIGLDDKSNDIDLHRFIRDACYFVFDLSIDNTIDTSNWELLRTGTLSVYMEFTNPIDADGIRLIALGEFDNLITVDKLRQIQYDYAI